MVRKHTKTFCALMLICVLVFSLFPSAQAAGGWNCAQCGLYNEHNFCRSCGAPQPTGTTVYCGQCGAAHKNADQYLFCSDCGASLIQATATPKPAADTVKCEKCGATHKASSNYRFCPDCGGPLAQAAQPTVKPTAKATVKPTVKPTTEAALKLSEKPTNPLFYWYDEDLRYYYQQLSATEKKLFSVLYDGIAASQEVIDVASAGVFMLEDLERVEWALEYDCPELFNISGMGTTNYRLSTGVINRVAPTYTMNADEFDRQLSRVQSAVRSLAALSGFGTTDYSKQLTIYQYILEQSTYEIDPPYTTHTNSVFIYGRSQCIGYVHALHMALRYYGIPCLAVRGYTYTDGVRDESSHAWSIVKIDGDWYQCDATWDDPVWEVANPPAPCVADGNGYIRYLNVTDEMIMANRVYALENEEDEPVSFDIPVCTSHAYNYAFREGIFVPANQQGIARFVRQQLIALRDEGLSSVAVYFEDKQDYQTCLDDINTVFNNLRNASNYHYWYSEEAHFLYFIIP